MTTRDSLENPSRRRFVVGTAAAGGGLALGIGLPIDASAQANALTALCRVIDPTCC
jgi:hypothetical protein